MYTSTISKTKHFNTLRHSTQSTNNEQNHGFYCVALVLSEASFAYYYTTVFGAYVRWFEQNQLHAVVTETVEMGMRFSHTGKRQASRNKVSSL